MATALKTQPVAVYTPASKLTDPTQLFQSMLRDLALSRELAWRLFIRNINARYRQTLLGYAWAVVMPIITTSVFVFLQKSGYFTVGETQVPYALFLITGLVLWQVFADAVQAPLRMVQQSYSILTKVNFPREALIITGAGEVLFAFLIRLTLIALAIFWFGIDVSWAAIWFPFGVLGLDRIGDCHWTADYSDGGFVRRYRPGTAVHPLSVDVSDSCDLSGAGYWGQIDVGFVESGDLGLGYDACLAIFRFSGSSIWFLHRFGSHRVYDSRRLGVVSSCFADPD